MCSFNYHRQTFHPNCQGIPQGSQGRQDCLTSWRLCDQVSFTFQKWSSSIRLTLFIVITGLVACASVPVQNQSARKRVDVDSHVLLAEIAWSRQQFEEAVEHFLAGSSISEDPALAERTSLAAHQFNFDNIGLQAANRWLSLSPTDVRAYQFLGIFEFRSGNLERALELFTDLMSLGENKTAGFELIVEGLVNEEDTEGAMAVLSPIVEAHADIAAGRYGLAQMALRSGDFEKTLVNAELAATLAPDWVAAQLLYARTLLVAGRTEDALELARHFAQEQPTVAVRLQYAELLISAGHGNEAREMLHIILEENPGHTATVRALGFLSLAENDLETSRNFFNELRAEPRYRDEAFYYLGRIAENNENFLQAMRSYSRVTGGTNAVEAQLRAADLLFTRLGDSESALQHLKDFGVANPNYNTEMVVAGSEVLTRMGRIDDAMNLINKALEEDAEDEALHDARVQLYIAMAREAENQLNLDEAQALLRKGLRLYSEDTLLRYAQALIYQKQGRIRRAVSTLRDLTEENPNDAGLLNALGYLMTDQGRQHQEARAYIQKALAMEPDNPAIIDSMGWVLFRLGQYKAALGYLERAYRLFPDPEVAAHLVDAYWVENKKNQALKLLEEALQDNPNSPLLMEVEQRIQP